MARLLLAGRGADDLDLSSEHRLLRATLRDFAAKRIAPRAQQIHRGDEDVPADIIAGVAELGLFALSIPEAYGGSLAGRPDHLAMLIGTEELSAASLAVGGSLMTRPEILVRALLSDVAAIQCRATRLPDGGWSVNGAKLWCTFAGRAHLVMLLCRTGSAPDHRGLSLFLLEKPSQLGRDFEHRQPEGGVLRGRAIPTLGYRGLHTFELAFADYRLPPVARVGEEGRGFYLQMDGFATGRLQTAARGVGVMHAAVRDTLAYTAQRSVFGKPVAEHELARQMIGRMGVRLHASRRLSYAAGALNDAGGGQVEASLAKLYASRMAEYVTRDAMQLFGGMGYGEETDVSRYFVDARVLAIFEGAEEVLALRVIGRALERVAKR